MRYGVRCLTEFPRQTECTVASSAWRKPEAWSNVGSSEVFILLKRHKSPMGQYLGFFKQGGKFVETHTIFVAGVHVSSTVNLARHGMETSVSNT